MKKYIKILLLSFLLSFLNIGYVFAEPFTFSFFIIGYTVTISISVVMAAITIAAIGYSLYQQQKLKKPLSRYAANEIVNATSNEDIVPIVYGGPIIMGGNIIWQSDPGATVQRFLSVCIGEVSAVTNVTVDKTGMSNNESIVKEQLKRFPRGGIEYPYYVPLNTIKSNLVLYGENDAIISAGCYSLNETLNIIEFTNLYAYTAAVLQGGGVEFKASYTAGFISGCSYTAYLGTSTQDVDSRCAGAVKGLRDLTYLALTLTAGDKVSSNPTVACYVTGQKIQTWNVTNGDWTTNALSSSKNPAAIIRDYLLLSTVLGGCGVPAAFVNDASFGASSVVCDQEVSTAAGGTEARYELDIVIDTKASALDNLTKFLVTCNMSLFRSGGAYKIAVEKPDETAVQAFTEDNIVKGSFTYGYGQADDNPNRVCVEWVEALEPKNPKRISISEDELDQSIRGVHELKIETYGIVRQSQASRLAKKTLYEKKVNDIWCELECNMSSLHCEQYDIVSITHRRPGWTKAAFRIIEITEGLYGRAKFLMQAYNGSVLDDGLGSSFDDWDYGAPANPFAAVTDVTNIALTELGWTSSGDGSWISHIGITWDAPANRLDLLDSYIIEIKKDSDDYISIGGPPAGVTSYRTNIDLDIGSIYYIKIKTKSINGIISDGTISTGLTLLGKSALPNNVSKFNDTFTDELVLTWDKNTDSDLAGYELRLEDANWGVQNTNLVFRGLATKYTIVNPGSRAPGTYYIKAYDTTGNFSSVAQSVTPLNSAPTFPTLKITHWFGYAKLQWTDITDTDLQYYELWKSSTNAWAGEETLESKVVGTEVIVQGNAPVEAIADSTSATTMVDATIKDKGADYFVGDIILQTSGTHSGQESTVTAYHTGTGRITVASWTDGTPDAADKFVIKDRAYFKVRGVDTYGLGGLSSAGTVDFTPLTADELGDAIISARKLIAGEVVTLSAQIKDAIITTAKILSLNADKINVGTLTGFTIRTSATSPRIEMTGDTLKIYDASGNVIVVLGNIS